MYLLTSHYEKLRSRVYTRKYYKELIEKLFERMDSIWEASLWSFPILLSWLEYTHDSWNSSNHLAPLGKHEDVLNMWKRKEVYDKSVELSGA